MSWEVRATDQELYAQFGNRGPVLVIAPDGVPMAKAVRTAIAKALDVDPEAVGIQVGRRVRA